MSGTQVEIGVLEKMVEEAQKDHYRNKNRKTLRHMRSLIKRLQQRQRKVIESRRTRVRDEEVEQ